MQRAQAALLGMEQQVVNSEEPLLGHLWQSSTVKKRKMKMNKHKLKKRRKLLRMNTKVSRG